MKRTCRNCTATTSDDNLRACYSCGGALEQPRTSPAISAAKLQPDETATQPHSEDGHIDLAHALAVTGEIDERAAPDTTKPHLLQAPTDHAEQRERELALRAEHEQQQRDRELALRAEHEQQQRERELALRAEHEKQQREHELQLRAEHEQQQRVRELALRAEYEKQQRERELALRADFEAQFQAQAQQLRVDDKPLPEPKPSDSKARPIFVATAVAALAGWGIALTQLLHPAAPNPPPVRVATAAPIAGGSAAPTNAAAAVVAARDREIAELTAKLNAASAALVAAQHRTPAPAPAAADSAQLKGDLAAAQTARQTALAALATARSRLVDLSSENRGLEQNYTELLGALHRSQAQVFAEQRRSAAFARDCKRKPLKTAGEK